MIVIFSNKNKEIAMIAAVCCSSHSQGWPDVSKCQFEPLPSAVINSPKSSAQKKILTQTFVLEEEYF
jgi:hypothetical protein